MPSGAPDAATDEDRDTLLRPAWEDTPDETDSDLSPHPAPRRAARSPDFAAAFDLPTLITPLCAATDVLARLDARALAAPDPVRQGLIARLAWLEASGWLAHAHAWVHPLDLALRDLGLAASLGLVGIASARALPHTVAVRLTDWDDQPFDVIATGDRAITDALALARILRRLPGTTGTRLFATGESVTEMLRALGAGALNPAQFAAWSAAHVPSTAHRNDDWRGEGAVCRPPPLLAAARAAQAWMETAVTADARPVCALLAAAALARLGLTRGVMMPIWSAYPAAGFGDREALPGLRSDAAIRVAGWGQPVTWPMAFLHLVTESARMGLRELDRLEAAAETGRRLVARCDKRSRLPDAVDQLVRTPVLTPKALAAQLKVAPQTATALLRELVGQDFIRDVTGRASFRAFAICTR